MTKKSKIDHYTDKEALDFHIGNKSGKIEVNSSKPLTTKRDLSLAYSPGVAAPVKEIHEVHRNKPQPKSRTSGTESRATGLLEKRGGFGTP